MSFSNSKYYSAPYFIRHTRLLADFVDKELPQIGDKIHIKEIQKYIEDKKGARKGIECEVRIIEEYPSGFLTVITGPSLNIGKYKIREYFRKDDFRKGLLEYTYL